MPCRRWNSHPIASKFPGPFVMARISATVRALCVANAGFGRYPTFSRRYAAQARYETSVIFFSVHTGYIPAPTTWASFISKSQYAPFTRRTLSSVAGYFCASSFRNSSVCMARRPYAWTTIPIALGGVWSRYRCRRVSSSTDNVSSTRDCSSASMNTHSSAFSPVGSTVASFFDKSPTHSFRDSSSNRGDRDDSLMLICGECIPDTPITRAALWYAAKYFSASANVRAPSPSTSNECDTNFPFFSAFRSFLPARVSAFSIVSPMVNLLLSSPIAFVTPNRRGKSTSVRGGSCKFSFFVNPLEALDPKPTTFRTAASATADALTSALLSLFISAMKSSSRAPMVSLMSRSGMYASAPLGTRIKASAKDISATPSGESTEYSLTSGSNVMCFRTGEWNERMARAPNSAPNVFANTASRRFVANSRSCSLCVASIAELAADADVTSCSPETPGDVCEDATSASPPDETSATGNRNEGSFAVPRSMWGSRQRLNSAARLTGVRSTRANPNPSFRLETAGASNVAGLT
mmetsp:Transcript_14107/g.46783  ORF Transcript_14107/g.46783 Transcript_14107/m.46783 type:complete len:523 (+) Transcript_14107:2096-3664(+)